MKGVFVILDGAADLPHKLLGDKTPLDVADMPNLSFFAARSELGYMYPVRPGFIPESDEAIVGIFGNEQISSTRGQLEAAGAGIKTTRGDLALRVNFATVDEKVNEVLDRRAGRTLTNIEAAELAAALNKKIKLPFNFEFVPTIQHRAALVFHGGFSEMISGNDVSYYEKGKQTIINKIRKCEPLDDSENSQYTANVVNEFLDQAREILGNHPVNQERKKRGLMPANYLLVRGAGIEKPNLKSYKKWISVVYMPLEIGFSKLCGMDIFSFDYPKLKELDAYENLHDGLRRACNFSVSVLKASNKSDYVYIHIKETDLPGHDNKPLEKKLMLEYIDGTLFKFLRKFCPANGIRLVVTCDHSTPCKLKAHSADPVPVLYYDAKEKAPQQRKFCEKETRRGSLGGFNGQELFKRVGFEN